MRLIANALALACTAGALVTGAAAPASANHPCFESERFCFVSDAFTIPAETPAAGLYGTGPYTVPGPRLCDSTTGECTETVMRLPGAYVSVSGTTLFSVNVPSYGVVFGPGSPTVYYGVPSLDPASSGLPDFTITAYVPYLAAGDGSFQCRPSGGSDGAVSAELTSDCYLVVTVRK